MKARLPNDILKILANSGFSANKISGYRVVHDPNTISSSYNYLVYLEKVNLFLKLYSKKGFPENEIEAYKILKRSGKEHVSPQLIDYNIDENSRRFALLKYIEGNKLQQDFTLMKSTKKKVVMLQKIIDRHFLFSKHIETGDSLKPLIGYSSSWLTPNMNDAKTLFLKSNERLFKRLVGRSVLTEKILEEYMKKIQSLLLYLDPVSIGFCHGDFTLRNMVLSDEIKFIDWEYSFYGPIEKDFGDLFGNYFLTINNVDFDLLKELKLENLKLEALYLYMIPQALTMAYDDMRQNRGVSKYLKFIDVVISELGI